MVKVSYVAAFLLGGGMGRVPIFYCLAFLPACLLPLYLWLRCKGGLRGALRQVLVLVAVQGHQLEPIWNRQRDRREGQHVDSW